MERGRAAGPAKGEADVRVGVLAIDRGLDGGLHRSLDRGLHRDLHGGGEESRWGRRFIFAKYCTIITYTTSEDLEIGSFQYRLCIEACGGHLSEGSETTMV